MPVTRRAFLKRSSALPFALWLDQQGFAQRHPYVRYNVMSSRGQAMLRIYRGAVHSMMNASKANPTSWVFQWYTHWVKPDFNPQTQINAINSIYNVVPPPPAAWKSLAQSMWSTCQAHGGGNEDFFLPWHRMFVFYFERIVRKISGHKEFTLPYWNYSDVSHPSGPRIPNPFINPGTTANPLWRHDRNPGTNAGNPIDQGQPNTPLNLDALRQCEYRQNGAIPGFCMDLDFGLHGTVHVLVGNTVGMGAVPWAANDPIFWLHHCNIDRLWASWNRGPNARQNPGDAAWLNQAFTFADENGHAVTAKNSDVDSIGKLGYSYDAFETLLPCPPVVKPPKVPLQQLVPQLAAPGPVELGTGPTRIRMTPGSAARAERGETAQIASALQALKPEQRLYLVLRELKAEAHPGVLYHVYLNLPSDAQAEQSPANHIGTINFFDAIGHAAHKENSGNEQATRFVSFDISERLPKLKSSGAVNAPETTLTIIPIGQPAGEAKPVIGQVSFVSQ